MTVKSKIFPREYINIFSKILKLKFFLVHVFINSTIEIANNFYTRAVLVKNIQLINL